MEPHSQSRNASNTVIPTNVGIQQAEKNDAKHRQNKTVKPSRFARPSGFRPSPE
jgi:hypothetical protein